MDGSLREYDVAPPGGERREGTRSVPGGLRSPPPASPSRTSAISACSTTGSPHRCPRIGPVALGAGFGGPGGQQPRTRPCLLIDPTFRRNIFDIGLLLISWERSQSLTHHHTTTAPTRFLRTAARAAASPSRTGEPRSYESDGGTAAFRRVSGAGPGTVSSSLLRHAHGTYRRLLAPQSCSRPPSSRCWWRSGCDRPTRRNRIGRAIRPIRLARPNRGNRFCWFVRFVRVLSFGGQYCPNRISPPNPPSGRASYGPISAVSSV
jgi:hypothetical protein